MIMQALKRSLPMELSDGTVVCQLDPRPGSFIFPRHRPVGEPLRLVVEFVGPEAP